MKRNKKFFLLTAVILTAIVACTQLTVVCLYPYYQPTNGAIVFGNYAYATKANPGVGPDGIGYDSFKVFGFEDNTAVMDPFSVEWQSPNWVYEGVNNQELQYFDRNSNQYSFIGIISDKTPTRTDQVINVPGVESFQTDDVMSSPKEFLYTQKTVPSSEYNQVVPLTFGHGNARMFLGFASDRNDTEIIDYVHQSYYNAKNSSNVWLRAGFSTPIISDEDIAYINSWYECSETSWPASSSPSYTFKMKDVEIPVAYKTTVDVGGTSYDFFDAKKYLASKYTISDWGNWSTPIQSGWLVLHMDKPSATYRGYFFDPWTSLSAPVVQELAGIRVFSVDDSNTPNVHLAHTVSADAHVAITGIATFDNVISSTDVIVFNHPIGAVAQAANTSIAWTDATSSPTVRYALPVNNTGYVVKFSYIYNGVTYYDARVLIPTVSAAFDQSKDYTYVIYITEKTNGTTSPSQAYTDKDEVDTSQKAIVFSPVNFNSYTSGGHYVYAVQ